jgi:hypothetical protein
MAGGSRMIPRKKCGVHATVFQAEIFAILACANDCTYRQELYEKANIYLLG